MLYQNMRRVSRQGNKSDVRICLCVCFEPKVLIIAGVVLCPAGQPPSSGRQHRQRRYTPICEYRPLSNSLSIHLSIHLYIYPAIYLSIYPAIHSTIYRSHIYPNIQLSICHPSVQIPIYTSIHLSLIHLSIHPAIYLFTH